MIIRMMEHAAVYLAGTKIQLNKLSLFYHMLHAQRHESLVDNGNKNLFSLVWYYKFYICVPAQTQ